MNIATPRASLAVNVADAVCAIDRLRDFITLLCLHETDAKMRVFLLNEVDAAAERVQEQVSRIAEETPR